VSEAGSVLFGRAELERAFTALGERLVRRGVVADVFIVGGAAMALAYDAARVTRDVDAIFKPHGIVHEEAMQVAKDLGLPRWWLNEQASTYISGKEDAGKRRVFDHPGLRVMAASPRHIFATNPYPPDPPPCSTNYLTDHSSCGHLPPRFACGLYQRLRRVHGIISSSSSIAATDRLLSR
jgi:hypothetical protein